MKRVFIGEFKNSNDIFNAFNVTDKTRINILFVSYDLYNDLGGNIFVLFEKNKKYYEVNGSHDSYFYLKGQWKPEETTIKCLLYRLIKGKLGIDQSNDLKYHDIFNKKLLKYLKYIEEI